MGASDKCTTGSTVRNDFRGGVRSGVDGFHATLELSALTRASFKAWRAIMSSSLVGMM
jgi:hypothetical protein